MKKALRPKFGVAHLLDGSASLPQIYRVDSAAGPLDRRTFIAGGAVSIPAVLGLFSSTTGRAASPPDVGLAHRNMVSSLEITSDGDTLLSTTHYGDVKKWRLPIGALIGHFPDIRTDESGILELGSPLRLTPDGTLLITAAGLGQVGGKISQWSFPTGQRRMNTLMGHSRRLIGLFVSPDGKLLISGSEDSDVRIWSLSTGQLIKTLDGPPEGIDSVSLSPDGTIVAAGGQRGSLRVWALPEGTLTLSASAQQDVSALLVSPDNLIVVAGLGNGSLQFWSLAEGRKLRTETLEDWIRALSIAPDGRTIVAGSNKGSLGVFSLPTGANVRTLRTAAEGISALQFIPRHNLLAVGGIGGEILRYDWPKLELQGYLYDSEANHASEKGMSFNVYDRIESRTITYTMPCGSPMPRGAHCICNCVPGTFADAAPTPPVRRTTKRPMYTPSPMPSPLPPTLPPGELRLPCTPTPVPPGYTCRCNCVPGQ